MTQYITDGFLKVLFVKTKENTSNIFTKNVLGDTLEAHIDDYVVAKEEVDK